MHACYIYPCGVHAGCGEKGRYSCPGASQQCRPVRRPQTRLRTLQRSPNTRVVQRAFLRAARAAQDPATEADVRVEALRALAHAALPPLAWHPALARSGLPAWLAAALAPGAVDDDIALEAVIAVGALCQPDTACLLSEAGAVRAAARAGHARRLGRADGAGRLGMRVELPRCWCWHCSGCGCAICRAALFSGWRLMRTGWADCTAYTAAREAAGRSCALIQILLELS